MKDCGHAPMMERPEEAARHYLEFLRAEYPVQKAS